MTRVHRGWKALMVVFLLTSGCASDGGVGGTGISTVLGNVANVDEFTVREPSTMVSVTSKDGFFELVGLFPGDITLEFVPKGSQETATMVLLVPAGSEVTLQNVTIGEGSANAEEIFVDLMRATLTTDASCEGPIGSIEVEDNAGQVFTVDVDEETSITQGDRPPLACDDLAQGFNVKISGTQRDMRITADEIRVLKTRSR